jgi:predicted ribosome quality control (RQC) complex YloA/Tae2 family protein
MGKPSRNFRKLILSSGITALAGKNAESNEELVEQAGKNEFLLHTASPGSPFVNIKADAKKTTEEDLSEAAIFCAKYSQVWKKAKVKKDIEVHVFLGKDISKSEEMKLGTFGVKKVKKITARKEDLEK